jgi:hypothetical protein
MTSNILSTIEECVPVSLTSGIADQNARRSGLSDIQATPTNSNTSQTDLSSHVKPNDEAAKAPVADEDDEDEEFIYPGSREETQPEPPQETVPPAASTSATNEQPRPVERDPAQLEEIYAAAVSGDLHILQTLFQSAVSSETGNTEAFALANDATTRTGLTPLHGAASRGHVEIVQWRE